MTRRGRFEPHGQGPLGITPEAFGFFFDLPEPPKNEIRDNVAIVSVRGPLMHHDDPFFDSYDAIGMRVLEALEARPKAVVLSIDSPGGLVSGCFELASELRDLCGREAVPLYAYVDGQATSAAYALACAADRIVAPESATIGSIGVLAELIDARANAAMHGVKVQLVTSGARKADGHPQAEITDGTLAAVQANVDAFARIFFDHVARARGLSPEDVQSLEAAQVTGVTAMGRGLVDQVSTFEQFLAAIADGTMSKETDMPKAKASKSYEDAIAALRKCSEGDDDEAAKAKRMLKAELADDDAPAPKDDEKKDDTDAKAKADGDDEEKKPDEEAKASAIAPSSFRALVSDFAAMKSEREVEKRTAMLARYPHVDAAMKGAVAKLSVEDAEKILAAVPKPAVPKPAAATTPAALRGAGQGDGNGSQLSPEETAAMDRAMGLVSTKLGVQRDGPRLYLGVPVPNDAK